MLDPSTRQGGGAANPPQQPFGFAKNSTASGARDGYAFEELLLNDFVVGWQSMLLSRVGLAPNGSVDDNLSSQQENSFAEILRLMVTKPKVANDVTDAANDLVFAPGIVPSKNTKGLIALASQLIKQKDVAWIAGDTAGGLFPGAVLGNVAYCFWIRNDTTGAVDAGFDDNAAASNIPPGWSAYRRVAKIPLSGGSFVAFDQNDDKFDLVTPLLDFSTAAPSIVGVPVTITAPPDSVAIVSQSLVNAATTYTWARSLAQANTAAGGVDHDIQTGTNSAAAAAFKEIKADSISQIRYRSSVGSVSAYQLYTHGWIDTRED